MDNITNRFVYGSYDEELGLNKSILSYNLYLKESGTISLRLKLKDVKTKSFRTILDIKNENSHNMLVYIDYSTYELKIKVPYGTSNEIIMNTGIIIEEEKWHLLTINYTLTSITIHIDDYTVSRNVNIDLKDCKTYVGVQIDNINTINPLYGNIEMLSYGNIINNIHNTLKDTGQVISVIKEYDNNDRVRLKTIDTGKTKEQIEYKYYDEDLNINPLIKKEVFKDLEIIYSYDKHNNITNIVHLKNDEIIKEIHYDYDGYSRLIKETCFNQNVLEYCYEYKYNNFSDILEKIEYNVNEEIINKEEYVYNDSRLIKVIKNEEVKEITYTDDYFRPSTYKGNTLVWEGKRLKSYKDIEYTYNSEGIRIEKQTNNKTFKYIVINGKVIKEIRTDGKEIIYHYDERGEVVGFNYNSNEYFYIRDITGQINKIINIDGAIEVEYEYNSYGKVLKEEGNSDLIDINSYLYKGYYYDKETSLYYCNSRYYDPEIQRFISIDDISYLDTETLSGINLYCYCFNNPISYSDPSGHFAISTLIVGAIIGFVVGGATSAVSQGLTKGWDNINGWQVLLDATIGGISGALGASGINQVVSMIAGGVLGAAGSIGGDLIASGGDWSQVNVGKAILMGAIGVGLGRWTGAGTQNSKAMVSTINAGKSWGSKAFLTSAKESLLRPNSGLTLQTMYMNMSKAISLYTVQGITKVSAATLGSTILGNTIGW